MHSFQIQLGMQYCIKLVELKQYTAQVRLNQTYPFVLTDNNIQRHLILTARNA